MKMIYCMNCMSKMEEEQEICPVCGYRWGSRPQPEYALRENSILHGRYLIGRVLGEGGFGITYLGFDLMLNIKVAIKEYFPMGAVNRNGSCSDRVSWNTSVVNRETGCRSFVKEAQKMARIDQIPEIVRVRDVFLTNETAYIVMDFVEGETLKDRLKREGPMGAEDCIRLLLPVIKGMARVHEQGMIHRDIKPDNIMLQKDGKVRLLDLGAAKEIDLQRNPERGAGINGGKNGNENLPPTQMVVSNGFSPLEQYSETGRIGPWTDVYAMCATIYYCITGKVLPASLDRISQEALPLTEEQKSKIPAQVLAVLEKGLALREDKRIQTMEELEQELKLRGPDPEPDPWWKRLWKAVLRRKVLIPVGIAILAAVVGLGIKFRMEPGTLAEGTCGEKLTWSLSPEGKLTIAGTGDMEDYNYTSEENELAPWYPYRDSIKEIEIGEGVKKIGVFAFLRCAMEQVTLPDTVEIIGENAFYDCNNLCEIEIPGKVTYIDQHTFYDCDKLETVTYRGERPETAENAFERCPLLTAEEATELIAEGTCGENLTWSLSSEGKLTIAGTGDMEDYDYISEENELAPWYPYLDSIKEIEIGEEVTGIGAWAFFKVNQVSSLHIPEKVSKLGERFASIGFSEITVDEQNEYYKDEDGVLYTADGTCIVRYPTAKEGTAYTVPDGVTEIGAYAFDECSLEQINLPDTLERIEKYAFLHCSSLGSIEIPSSVKTIGKGGFYGCDKLETVTYRGEMPKFGKNAFAECPLLTAEEAAELIAEGTCGENLTWSLSKGKLTIAGTGDMEDYAGGDTNRAPWDPYRGNITEIEVGEEVTGIGAWAFFRVNQVSALYIPEKVSKLGKRFAGMAGISEITVDEKNEYFKDEDGVVYTADGTCIVRYPTAKEGTAYTVPDGVAEIGAYAFDGCSLEQIHLPDTLERIGDYAFFRCSSLGSIEIPASVKTIGEGGFYGCEKLETVTYRGEIPEIAENAFEKCPLLTTEEAMELIAEGTCGENLTWSLSSEGKLIIAGTGDMEDYYYTSEENELAPWYPYRDSITEIEIGEKVTGIGQCAFFGINNVQSLSIPGEVSRLGIKFSDCMAGISEITVNEQNEYFRAEDGVLYTADQTCIVRYPQAKEGNSYTVPEGVKEISAYAFTRSDLEQVKLPDTVEIIGKCAFYDCNNLCEIEIPGKVTVIEQLTFYGCEKLETVTYRGEMPEIAENAFEGCPVVTMEEAAELIAEGTCGENLTWSLSSEGKLTIAGTGDMEDYDYMDMASWYPYMDLIEEIEIGEEVTGIGAYAFFRVNQVSSLHIPAKVSKLGESFSVMEGLSEITVDEKNEYYKDEDGVLYTVDGTCIVSYPEAKEGTAYTVPDGVVEIGAYAFEECSLEQINLPDTLKRIGERAFIRCRSLGSIEIPASVKTIEERAFYQCDKLETVTCRGEVSEIAENAFAECPLLE